MVQGIGRADHGVGEFGQIDRSAHGFQGVVLGQLVGHGDYVNGLVGIVELDEGLENVAVDRRIEIIVGDDVHQLVEHVFGLENAAENGLFRFKGVRGNFA